MVENCKNTVFILKKEKVVKLKKFFSFKLKNLLIFKTFSVKSGTYEGIKIIHIKDFLLENNW
jgi:hypothetical protein